VTNKGPVDRARYNYTIKLFFLLLYNNFNKLKKEVNNYNNNFKSKFNFKFNNNSFININKYL
jgi:hypothetical protein